MALRGRGRGSPLNHLAGAVRILLRDRRDHQRALQRLRSQKSSSLNRPTSRTLEVISRTDSAAELDVSSAEPAACPPVLPSVLGSRGGGPPVTRADTEFFQLYSEDVQSSDADEKDSYVGERENAADAQEVDQGGGESRTTQVLSTARGSHRRRMRQRRRRRAAASVPSGLAGATAVAERSYLRQEPTSNAARTQEAIRTRFDQGGVELLSRPATEGDIRDGRRVIVLPGLQRATWEPGIVVRTDEPPPWCWKFVGDDGFMCGLPSLERGVRTLIEET